MNDNTRNEIGKLLACYNAVAQAHKDYAEQLMIVNGLLKCPVCPNGHGKITHEFGNYKVICDCCGFHVGKSDNMKELMERWTTVVDTIEQRN